MASTTIRALAWGQSAQTSALKAAGHVGRRFPEMRSLHGCVITVSGRAPLIDPVTLKIFGNTLSLRNSQADYIFADHL